ncbi:MAG TPA: glycosyltransferase family 39 protein [Gammaproteobacteria bacterium]|nr:glycosyltransferase family 39 protein [Gammaproteobacteria bacterium]
MKSFRSTVFPVVFLLGAFAFVMLFQGSRGLWEPDEGRYTGIASQMIRSADYLHPAFNDDLKHYAKPPFTYWAIASALNMTGFNEWSARLPNAIAFSFTVLLLFLLARTITPARPWLPPLIYLSFLFPSLAANVVTTDTLLTLWETLAVFGFVAYWKDRSRRRKFPVMLMWFGFGMAFITKGPPGLLPLLVILAFVVFIEGRRAVTGLFSIAGIVIFIVFGFGWYIAIIISQPDLVSYFFYDEFINRIATGVHHRNAQWYGAFVIYGPTLILGTLPWTLPLLRAVKDCRQSIFSRSWWKLKQKEDPFAVFLILWLVIPLTIFFLARSRLPLYILPLFPALALIVGKLLSSWQPGKSIKYAFVAWLIFLPGLKWVLSVIPYKYDSRPVAQAIAAKFNPLPAEINFVDIKPFWGLSFYLKAEVERINLDRKQSAHKGEDSLEQELASEDVPMLLIARKDQKEIILTRLHDIGYADLNSWQQGDWLYITPNSRLDWKLTVKD